MRKNIAVLGVGLSVFAIAPFLQWLINETIDYEKVAAIVDYPYILAKVILCALWWGVLILTYYILYKIATSYLPVILETIVVCIVFLANVGYSIYLYEICIFSIVEGGPYLIGIVLAICSCGFVLRKRGFSKK